MRRDYTGVIDAIIIIVVVVIIAAVVGFGIANERNRISSGVIVDKEYDPGYNHSSARTDSDGMVHYERYNRPPQYQFCIEGEKDGKTVRYWFDVTPAEYDKYNIGDTYFK